jgi:raffinose/stachyose/melibiose transport system permease protein
LTSSIARNSKRRSNGSTAFFFLLPALLVYGTYTLYGIVRTFQYSTLKWTGMGPASQAANVGLANYARLLQDSHFWHALSNNMLLVVVSVVFQLSIGMVLALILNTGLRGTKLFRTVYFMPLLLSTVATGILWQLMLDPYSGLFNGLLKIVSPKEKLSWLGSEKVVMFAVLFVICWQYIPST